MLIGPSPPPYHGVSVMTDVMETALRAIGCKVARVDTADRRQLGNVGRLDIGNVVLGVKHAWQSWRAARTGEIEVTVLPVSQAALPVLRDALFAVGPALCGSHIVLHLHGSYFGRFYQEASFGVRSAVRWLTRRASLALVLSENGCANFEGLLPPDRIKVLPNAVPDLGTGPGEGATRGSGTFRVLYLANLVRTKGYLDVLRAAAMLKRRISRFEVLLAGEVYDGAEEAAALVEKHDLVGTVRFEGVVTGATKERLLRTADVLAFPTYYPFEGQPLVLLEAMAAGLPIVTTRQGYIADTVEEGGNAIIVPARSAEALATALADLWREPARRERMGQRSRHLWESRYRPELLAQRVEEILKLCAPRGRR